MNILTTKEINKALLLKDAFRDELEFSGVSIDTRTIKKGNLFIPIRGKNYDGHNYIGEAFEKCGKINGFTDIFFWSTIIVSVSKSWVAGWSW